MIYRTTTYYKIRDMQAKICVVQGGQGAGKNIGIAQILKEEAEEEPSIITVMSDTYDNLKDGAIFDFKTLWNDSCLDWDSVYNKTDKDLKHFGSIIQFRYISDVKPEAGKSKRRDILYLNEGNKFGWAVASTYIGRTHKKVYIDHNPDYEYWAHTEIPKLLDENGNRMDEMIIVTYKDNEMCPRSEVQYIEARKGNVNWFRVYGLGQVGHYSDRRIYDYEFVDMIPDTAMRINSGMDFGISPDPTILVDLYIDGINLYVDERFCMNNLLPETIEIKDEDGKVIGTPDRLSIRQQLDAIEFTKGQMIVGDVGGKTAIFDMRKDNGYNIRAIFKPPGSQAIGIGKVKCYNIKLTKRSINIKKGIEAWFYKIDQNGKIIPEPQRHEPDGLAAMRYGVMTYIK